MSASYSSHHPALRRPIFPPQERTPATQLEIAAHWLEELAVGHDQKDNLLRVARECKAVAYREGKV